jgi:hypothetical protein
MMDDEATDSAPGQSRRNRGFDGRVSGDGQQPERGRSVMAEGRAAGQEKPRGSRTASESETSAATYAPRKTRRNRLPRRT